ncbi:PEP-CTERM sorting domain-containing protein [Paludibacterium yongneupense]|uniref:PEP-CTERM sorting domain-containing protein n=1 Tax=Paludibacterium yongneupense TaxID=400061 RepID=UPI0003F9F3CB|nr:PEP-CTERM sorting domain-containing protein [Paludibacterium yongneupense]
MREWMAVLMMAMPGWTLAASMVVNGDFASGSFSGWTLSGNTSYSAVSPGRVFGHKQYLALLGPSGGTGTLAQQLNTIPGQHYRLSFDLKSLLAAPTEFLSASFGGQTVFQRHDAAFGWEHFSFDVESMGAQSLLSFTYRDDPGFFHLANISVTPVPEPEAAVLLGLGLAGALLARRRKGRIMAG